MANPSLYVDNNQNFRSEDFFKEKVEKIIEDLLNQNVGTFYNEIYRLCCERLDKENIKYNKSKVMSIVKNKVNKPIGNGKENKNYSKDEIIKESNGDKNKYEKLRKEYIKKFYNKHVKNKCKFDKNYKYIDIINKISMLDSEDRALLIFFYKQGFNKFISREVFGLTNYVVESCFSREFPQKGIERDISGTIRKFIEILKNNNERFMKYNIIKKTFDNLNEINDYDKIVNFYNYLESININKKDEKLENLMSCLKKFIEEIQDLDVQFKKSHEESMER